MKLVEASNTIYNFIVNTLLGSIIKGAFFTWVAKKVVDMLAKPLYDWCVRKGYMEVKVIKAKKAQDNLNKAQTSKERDEAIDEMP